MLIKSIDIFDNMRQKLTNTNLSIIRRQLKIDDKLFVNDRYFHK